MNPQDTQQTNQQLSPDEAAASLAFATKLSEGMMPKMAPEEQVEGQEQSNVTQETPAEGVGEAPVDEVVEKTSEGEEKPPVEEPDKQGEQLETLTKDFAEFKGNIEGMITAKFDDLTKTLKDALKD